MKTTTILSLLIITLLSCNNIAKQNQNDEWKLAKIGFPYGEEALNSNDENILSELRQMTITINNDTICINGKYKAKIVKKKSSTNKYFGDSETLKRYFMSECANKGVNIIDSIVYWELEYDSAYPNFSFDNYSLWGTLIGNENYICLVYNQVYVLWFEKSNSSSHQEKTVKEEELPTANSTTTETDNVNQNTQSQSCIAPSKYTLPYNRQLDYENVSYELLSEQAIIQPDNPEQACYAEDGKIRYIPLPNKNNISIIIAPQDGGDFPYRYYLFTIIENKIIDSMYVEGEWCEPGSDDIIKTSFSIDTAYKITISASSKTHTDVKSYCINAMGEFSEIK